MTFHIHDAQQKQPTPRKGTETLCSQPGKNTTTKQPTPRKGTETLDTGRPRIAYRRNNPHPARGRKLEDDNVADNRIETTHTPQGDGNKLNTPIIQSDIGNNPHPARGRKRTVDAELTDKLGNNPHPARGRKRGREHPRSTGSERNNPHPARGRKRIIIYLLTNTLETTHTPQGDGNLQRRSNALPLRKQPTPRKGTETSGSISTPVKSNPKQPTPRKGTETHYNLPPYKYTRNNPHPARGRKLFVFL